jgi:hypothetical protein
MDPVSAAIVAALAAGATSGVTEVGKNAVTDAYNALKAAIKRRFGADSKLVKTVDDLEGEPDSPGYRAVLQEQVKKAQADQDTEIVTAAQALHAQVLAIGSTTQGTTQNVVTATGAGSAASGSGPATVTNTWGGTAPPEPRQQP